jgi:transcriptional regulator with XRE-family HTH domain
MNSPTTNLNDRVAQRVQAEMEAAGVTQLRLSEESGIPRATLIRRLRGQSSFNIDEVELIAKALGCSLRSLLLGDEAA